MAMKLGHAYCEELKEVISPYRARELYHDETGKRYRQRLNFVCENPDCRVRLRLVGVYTSSRSKGGPYFRSEEEHRIGCSYRSSDSTQATECAPGRESDNYKTATDFPDELLLNLPIHAGTFAAAVSDSLWGRDEDGGNNEAREHGEMQPRGMSRTFYFDWVVDRFLSDDKVTSARPFTIAGKIRPFKRFFKKIEHFTDETGLIYYGALDRLKVFGDQGLGLRFVKPAHVEEGKLRIWVYIPRARIEASPRKKALFAELTALHEALDAGAEVQAFFVGAYPERVRIVGRGGNAVDIFQAELASINHLSLVFAIRTAPRTHKLPRPSVRRSSLWSFRRRGRLRPPQPKKLSSN